MSERKTSEKKIRACIRGIRDYFPAKILTNKDLEKIVETSDEWIRERTGIQERRISEVHETPGFMGTKAALELLKDYDVNPNSIDLILVATITGDYVFPATASVIQRGIGATKAFGYDL